LIGNEQAAREAEIAPQLTKTAERAFAEHSPGARKKVERLHDSRKP